MLTAERLRELFRYDPATGSFTRLVAIGPHGCHRAGRVCGSLTVTGYLEICIDRRRFLSHRLAWFYIHGRWPSHEIDHINGVRNDNRLANLREATHAQNLANIGIPKHNTSGLKGVCFDKSRGKWVAGINRKGTRINLGRFDTAEQAHAAYLAAAKVLHREFARPSFCAERIIEDRQELEDGDADAQWLRRA